MEQQTRVEMKVWEHTENLSREVYLMSKEIARLRRENKALKHHNRVLVRYKKHNEAKKGKFKNGKTKSSRTF